MNKKSQQQQNQQRKNLTYILSIFMFSNKLNLLSN